MKKTEVFIVDDHYMVIEGIRTLMQGRLFERDIYMEKFLSNADAEQGLARSPLFRNI